GPEDHRPPGHTRPGPRRRLDRRPRRDRRRARPGRLGGAGRSAGHRRAGHWILRGAGGGGPWALGPGRQRRGGHDHLGPLALGYREEILPGRHLRQRIRDPGRPDRGRHPARRGTGAMTAAGFLDTVTRRFAADEMLVRADRTTAVNVAAVGTLATLSLGSPLLDAAWRAAGIRIGDRTARTDLDGLLTAPDWDLALVLSPFKGQATGRCDRLAPRAAATGVVDTLVRANGEVVGYKTNSHAWAAAATRLMGSDVPERILVVGSGATARSVTFGALQTFPQARTGVAARSRAAAKALVSEHAGSEYVPDPGGFAPSLVAHVTTVG